MPKVRYGLWQICLYLLPGFSKSFFNAVKGQVSIELILAVIVAVTAASAFSLVGTEIIGVQQEASVRHQLDGIGTGLASAISKSALLGDSDTASISIEVPMIAVMGEDSLRSCSISIGGPLGADVMALAYDTVTVAKKFVAPAGMTVPAQATCGGTLTITRP